MIRTERLLLKVITHDSLNQLVELLTDDVVNQTYMVPDFQTLQEAYSLGKRLILLSEDPKRYVFGIYLDENLIGILNATDVVEDQIEVGYALIPRYHNRGFATEALRGALEFLFAQGFRKVLAGAFEENIPSIRVMQKCGMQPLACGDKIEYRGTIHTCVYYSVEKGCV